MTTFIFLSTLVLTGTQVLVGLLGIALLLAVLVTGVKLYWQQQHNSYCEAAKDLPTLSKKYRAVDVRAYSSNIKLLSLVTAIGLVLLIFAWTHYSYDAYYEGDGLVVEGLIEDVPVTTHPPQNLPALPPPPATDPLKIKIEEKPIIEPEPVVEPTPTVPTTGPNDGKANLSIGNIVIEPEPSPPKEEELPPETTWTVVEQMPRFPGCENIDGEHQAKKQCADQKMLSFIYDNIRYPRQALEIEVEGTVVVSFVVDKQGKIQDIKLLRDPGAGLGKEAIRIIRMMNNLPEAWTPGKQRGRAVKVQYNLPVRFKIK
jgi:protein TonB